MRDETKTIVKFLPDYERTVWKFCGFFLYAMITVIWIRARNLCSTTSELDRV